LPFGCLKNTRGYYFRKPAWASGEEILNIMAILHTGKEQLQNKQLYSSEHVVTITDMNATITLKQRNCVI
jgi:hypothetical protein